MSSTKSVDVGVFIQRSVSLIRESSFFFPSGYLVKDGTNLVTDVLAQEPPIGQSANDAVMPMIYAAYSKNSVRGMKYVGRDTIDVAGARTYDYEFYNVIMIRGITREESQSLCEQYAQEVSDILQNAL